MCYCITLHLICESLLEESFDLYTHAGMPAWYKVAADRAVPVCWLGLDYGSNLKTAKFEQSGARAGGWVHCASRRGRIILAQSVRSGAASTH